MKPQYWICAGIGADGERYAVRCPWGKHVRAVDAVKECYGTVSEGYVAKAIGPRRVSEKRFRELVQDDNGWITFRRRNG